MAIFDKKASFKREHLFEKEDVTQGLYSRGRVLFEKRAFFEGAGFFREGALILEGGCYSGFIQEGKFYSRGRAIFKREHLLDWDGFIQECFKREGGK